MQFLRNITYLFIFIFFGNAVAISQDLSLVFGDYSGEMGDTVCIDLTVENFEGVSSLEWRTLFDPSIIRYVSIDLTTSDLNEGVGGDNLLSTSDFNLVRTDEGIVIIVWANGPPEGVTLNDGDILYTLCFEIIGDPCESSVLATGGNPNTITITIAEPLTGGDIELPESEINLVNGSVTVDPNGLFIAESHCSTDDNSDTGSITFAGSGGNGPYSWTLMGPGGTNEAGSGLNDCETEVIGDLGPGTYTLIITDSNNVTRNESITIESSSTFPFILSLDGIDPTCFNKDNGSVFIDNIQGGEGSFTYEWSNQNFVDDNITKLETGEYSLTITDENGCSTSASYELAADTVKVDVVVVSDPSCDGSMDGIISFTGSGGTPYSNGGYNYDVDGIDTTFYIGNVNQFPGSYSPANFFEGCFSVKVIDSLGCPSDTTQFCLEAGSFSTLTMETVDASCFGECDGTILITAANFGNFIFQVTDQSGATLAGAINDATTYEAQNLCPGTYMATVTDNADGCFIDTMFTIGEPLLLEMTIDSIGPGCGGGDGMVTLDAIGGTMPYEFLWDDAYDQPVRTNMQGGNYSVTVTDANGCQDEIMWTFAQGGSIGLSAGVLNAITCESSADGSVRATVTAPGTFTFTWEDSNGVFIGNGNIIENLSGGVYTVTATDGNCTGTATVILAPGQTPSATVAMTSPSCNNSTDGMLTASLLEGVMPAMFEWNIPPSLAIVSSGAIVTGSAGVYNLHITDDNGCESDELFEILPSPDSIVVDITNVTENFCFGECTAGATFTASGGPAGTGEYTFIINGSAVPATGGMVTSTNLCAGTNFVIALDGVCFTDTIYFDILDTDELMIDLTASSITPPTCNGDTDGSISAIITGGNNSSYDLLWINEGTMDPNLSNLAAGQYYLQITDGNGCTVIDTIDLITPDPLMVDIDPFVTTDLVCALGEVGLIGLNTMGGNPGELTYNWSPDVSTSAIAENLAPGSYSVTVSDVNGCTDAISYELASAPPIIVSIPTPESPDCFGGTTVICLESVTGGIDTNYTYAIQNGPSLPIDSCFTLFAGEYSIKVFDSSGPECAFDTTLIIDQPSQVTVDVGEDLTIDLGSSTDPVSAFIVSELDIDSISWTPEVNIECNTIDCQVVTFSPDATTTYTVTVTDENGCLATDDIQVVVDLTRNVYTPNIFSPNSDNENDHFQIIAGNGVTMVNYLKIYDRWGNLVYMDESYIPNDTEHIGWDGTRNGQANEPGVYVFFAEVEFIDGVSIIYKGDVTLVR